MNYNSFAAEVCELRPDLIRYTRKFTNDHQAGLDLVQDTLLKALLYQSKFREDVNLKGWLFTIMRNTFINQYHKDSKFQRSHGDTARLQYLAGEETHTFNNPERNVQWIETWNAINLLDEDLGTPFKMHTSGYKYQEIAEHLNLPLGTVKNRIFQARQEIQKQLCR